MKTNFLSFVKAGILVSLLSLNACKGPDGPQGLPGTAGVAGQSGAAGATGDKGPKGDQGLMGNANVQYTTWQTPNWTNYSRNSDNMMAFLNVANTAMPIFTQAVMDSSMILVYLKTQNIEWDQSNNEYKLMSKISSEQSTYGFYKIAGRESNNYEDFIQFSFGTNLIGTNFFNPYLQVYTQTYNYTTQKYVATTDLIGKNAAFFKDMVKDLPQYRVVIIPATSKIGRMATVNYKDYDTVKRVYGIND